jgi:hypothetical protein
VSGGGSTLRSSSTLRNGQVPAAGNAGPPLGANGNVHVSSRDHYDKDHDHGRDHHRFHRRRDRDDRFVFRDNNFDPSCYEHRLVHTKYGPQWIRIYICN